MISVRPAMHARDSSGRQVSLLNDEPNHEQGTSYATPLATRYESGRQFSRSNSNVSESSPPRTPGLWRSGSYDSRTSNDPHSPLTPSVAEYVRRGSYVASYPDPSWYEKRVERSPIYASYGQNPAASEITTQPTYAEGAPSANDEERVDGSASEHSPAALKRYPCRFKQLHNCDKSFTTSGHASRHSKIHTAEKAVHCSYQDCPKKFTRADNMKQHLETHYKDRARAVANQRRNSLGAPKLALAAGVKKPSLMTRTTSRPSSRAGWTEQLSIDTNTPYAPYPADRYSALSSYPAISPTTTSPRSSYGALDMASFQQALPTSALTSTTPGGVGGSGLDALAAAIASQTGQ